MNIEQFLTDFSQYLHTEPGSDLLVLFFGLILAMFFMGLFFYDVLKGTFLVLLEIGETVIEGICKHTKRYKEKYAKALAIYSTCEDTVQQLWAEDTIDRDQYMVFLNSLEEHKDRHTRG